MAKTTEITKVTSDKATKLVCHVNTQGRTVKAQSGTGRLVFMAIGKNGKAVLNGRTVARRAIDRKAIDATEWSALPVWTIEQCEVYLKSNNITMDSGSSFAPQTPRQGGWGADKSGL